ncbi:YjcZ family sporulation protein [Heyndrickxia ginsengihumi]
MVVLFILLIIVGAAYL